jgi:WhiB family redox-sensing transcriptional regulator
MTFRREIAFEDQALTPRSIAERDAHLENTPANGSNGNSINGLSLNERVFGKELAYLKVNGECNRLDSNIFVPSQEVPRKIKAENERVALLICDECKVIERCLEFALENRVKDGVWGGTTAADRRRILRRRDGKLAS